MTVNFEGKEVNDSPEAISRKQSISDLSFAYAIGDAVRAAKKAQAVVNPSDVNPVYLERPGLMIAAGFKAINDANRREEAAE